MQSYKYLILGAGRQGLAAAYDLAQHGEASQIVLADRLESVATEAAARVNRLVGRTVASGRALDVTDPVALEAALRDADAALSAVPYFFNLVITRAAIAAQTHLCDMGGNTTVTRAQLALDDEARAAGISVVPDCGMGPGLVNTMGVYAMDLLDTPEEIYIYDAGLPQNPIPPWNYAMTFHINGLTNEMDGQAVFLRDGAITYVDTLSEPEFIEVPGLGRLEGDVTSGGTSTAPWTLQGRLQRFENKVLRYLGHFEWLRAFKTLGLFSEAPLDVHGQTVIPRDVYHALLAPKITVPDVRDVCVMHIRGVGLKDGRRATVTIDLLDRYDEKTGFTAMERLTGWHCAIVLALQVRAQVAPGCTPLETAMPAKLVMDALTARGIPHTVRWE